MAFCGMRCRIWPKRSSKKFLASLIAILAVIYFINVSMFFYAHIQDESTSERRDADVQESATNAYHMTNDTDDGEFHPRWVRKPYSPNAVLKPGVLGNYEPQLDKNRTGPGEYGVPVPMEESEKLAGEKSSFIYGFNMVNSDKISLDRIVNDIRDSECQYWHYPENLPTASVVIVFYNEGWSTFVRTVHSAINMSPPQLLHEVVLVDDASDKVHLKAQLDEHMAQFGSKVKIVRNKEHEGLIRSRSIGARAASGDVLVFLDAHCECSPNWLPPLLTRIAYDRTIMAAPIIDLIHWSEYTYKEVTSGHTRGVFEWGFYYKEMPVPEKELAKRQHNTEPYWSPTNAGGLFAIERKFFLELGAYDPNLEIWGGENFELAFKVWLCGGSSEWVPCSRVGHMYRHHGVSKGHSKRAKLPFVLMNYLRVVEVWMDEFKEYFYRRMPEVRGFPLDVSKQLQFKKDNHCKNFKWFMDNVAYDMYTRYPAPAPNIAWGKISSRHTNSSLCLAFVAKYDSNFALGTTSCSHPVRFRLNALGQIGYGERCVTAFEDKVILSWCKNGDITGPWRWDKERGQLYNKDVEKCVAIQEKYQIRFTKCDEKATNQKWDFIESYAYSS